MSVARPWTPYEDQKLRELWQGSLSKQIAFALNRTAPSVEKRAKRLGLPRKQPAIKPIDEQTLETIKAMRPTRTYREISDVTGLTEMQIYHIVRKLDLPRKPRWRGSWE